MIEVVSASEIDVRLTQGWKPTGKETWIAGKLRTIEMTKEGDDLAWLDDRRQIIARHVSSLSKREQQIYFQRTRRQHRGLD